MRSNSALMPNCRILGSVLLALQLLASVLTRALHILYKMDLANNVEGANCADKADDSVWAYALWARTRVGSLFKIAHS
jgi:hypothetical protein